MQAAATTRSIDYRALSIALALVCAAIGYAFPLWLFPGNHVLNGTMSPEILNMYAIVCWMGLAHFVYAYHGQAMALRKNPARIAPYGLSMVLAAAVLIALRHALGWMLFSIAMWVYFMPHFIKAELHFGKVLEGAQPNQRRWSVYGFPTVAFTFLSAALFCPIEIAQNHWLMLSIAAGLILLAVRAGAIQALCDKSTSGYMLLGFFLLGEGLVWAMYRQYMVFQFQEGIFVFHVALASFYHYFRSYDFAARTKFKENTGGLNRYLIGIFLVNAALLTVGAWSLRAGAAPWLFDLSFFTFWVGLHQFSSDLFGILSRR
jgi:hypothetical protein